VTFRILQIAIPFVWFGAVAAISFMEAPLKFSAPDVTIPIGLGIGQLVFHMLNRVEIVLCLSMAISLFLARPPGRLVVAFFGIAAAVLAVQTLGLFPLLDARAKAVIAGNAAPFSGLHVVYIATDTLKLITLAALGVTTTTRALKNEK
jgi:hypothetical protein